jgi:hypothetical protein
MGLNIAIGYVIGVITFIGDAFDFIWKPNNKNMKLLRERATVSPEEAKSAKKSDWLFVLFIIAILISMLIGSLLISLAVLGLVSKNLWDLFK